MGKLDQVNQLETYIEDLGKEIGNVKKASDYLKLIEMQQSEISKISASLIQTKNQLKLYQEIIESKLELFQTTAKNIEAKHQLLEKTQQTVLTALAEMKEQQEKDVKGTQTLVNAVNLQVSQSQKTLTGELARVQEEQNTKMLSLGKTNKIYFFIHAALLIAMGTFLFFTM